MTARGVVFETDDLLSLVELAKYVEEHAAGFAPLDNDKQPLPLRVSVGDVIGEGWVAHVVVDPRRGTYVDFNSEQRDDL